MAVAAPVSAYLVSAGWGATAAAVGGSVVQGIVIGAAVGAATAAIKDEDIGEGALKGAIIGGVSAGLFTGAEIALTSATGESILAARGIDFAAGAVSTDVPAMATTTAPSAGDSAVGLLSSTSPSSPGAVTAATPAKKGLDPGTTQIIAGTLGGLAEGYMASEDAENAVRAKEDADRRRVAENMPGELLTTQFENIKIRMPERWKAGLKKYSRPLTGGLLKTGVTA